MRSVGAKVLSMDSHRDASTGTDCVVCMCRDAGLLPEASSLTILCILHEHTLDEVVGDLCAVHRVGVREGVAASLASQ